MKRIVHIFSREPGLKEIIASMHRDVELKEICPPSPVIEEEELQYMGMAALYLGLATGMHIEHILSTTSIRFQPVIDDIITGDIINRNRCKEGSSLTTKQINELEEAEVLISDPQLAGPLLSRLKNLKWMQSTWAGNDAMKNFVTTKPTFVMTRMADTFGYTISEYVLAQIIIHERHLDRYWQQQKDKIWKQRSVRSLQDLTLGILGAGNIGCHVAKVAKNIGMTTWGLVRRELPSHDRSPFVDHYRTQNNLQELLSENDYICNVLPNTSKTMNLLSGNVLKVCEKKKPVFINVGRGGIIDDNSLITAIRNGWISAAILDVFNEEPLPADHPFWTIPEITITPHISGPGIPVKISEVFVRNLKFYNANKDLDFVYNWDEEY
ncbi:Glyoxylate/hydroxypyruvate reductase A [Trichoplax sp. H2]|nr:Glyoxylate/hydroxypyruvate reductase A [Trichoplax sp. H2]|eukprot:RDD40763.1 Glyoxylate/hydroxypyruvate reductase A [Trichoplax sp. H2]